MRDQAQPAQPTIGGMTMLDDGRIGSRGGAAVAALARGPPAARPAAGAAAETRAEGYAIQARLEARDGRPQSGWKIAATSAAGQAHIGLDGPIAGRVLAGRSCRPARRVPLGANAMRVAEPEFVFRLAADLPPRGAALYPGRGHGGGRRPPSRHRDPGLAAMRMSPPPARPSSSPTMPARISSSSAPPPRRIGGRSISPPIASRPRSASAMRGRVSVRMSWATRASPSPGWRMSFPAMASPWPRASSSPPAPAWSRSRSCPAMRSRSTSGSLAASRFGL